MARFFKSDSGVYFVKQSLFERFVNTVEDTKDWVLGGTKADREFAKIGREVSKQREKEQKIYFRVIEYNNNDEIIPMLVFYTVDKVVKKPSMNGKQVSTIKKFIKLGKCKGYLFDNDIEILERVAALPNGIKPENLYKSNRFYDVEKFMAC